MRVAICISGNVPIAYQDAFMYITRNVMSDWWTDIFLHGWENPNINFNGLQSHIPCSRMLIEGKTLSEPLATLYSTYRCNELRKEHQRQSGTVYDIVSKVKFDSFFPKFVNMHWIAKQGLHSPITKANGVSDSFVIATPDAMDVYANTYNIVNGLAFSSVEEAIRDNLIMNNVNIEYHEWLCYSPYPDKEFITQKNLEIEKELANG